jgi:hypothetical protein
MVTKIFRYGYKIAKINANSLSVGEVAKRLSEKDLRLEFPHTVLNDEKRHLFFAF